MLSATSVQTFAIIQTKMLFPDSCLGHECKKPTAVLGTGQTCEKHLLVLSAQPLGELSVWDWDCSIYVACHILYLYQYAYIYISITGISVSLAWRESRSVLTVFELVCERQQRQLTWKILFQVLFFSLSSPIPSPTPILSLPLSLSVYCGTWLQKKAGG